MTDIKDTLAALSEAATPNDLFSMATILRHSEVMFGGVKQTILPERTAASLECLAEIAIAYRSGQLVPVPSVEAVAQVLCRAPGSLCVGFCHSKNCRDAVAQFGDQATAIVAALAGEQ